MMEFDPRTRRILEDVLHRLTVIDGGTIQLDSDERFPLDLSDELAGLRSILPPRPYVRPSDEELAAMERKRS